MKVLGIAGMVGVAATGVAVARAERRRRAYTPEDIRARLHARHDEAVRVRPSPTKSPVMSEAATTRTERIMAPMITIAVPAIIHGRETSRCLIS